jgi:hypothetical protein
MAINFDRDKNFQDKLILGGKSKKKNYNFRRKMFKGVKNDELEN